MQRTRKKKLSSQKRCSFSVCRTLAGFQNVKYAWSETGEVTQIQFVNPMPHRAEITKSNRSSHKVLIL